MLLGFLRGIPVSPPSFPACSFPWGPSQWNMLKSRSSGPLSRNGDGRALAQHQP